MKDLKRHQVDSIELIEKNDEFYVGSEQVARHFNKNHRDVLRAIRTLLADLPEVWGLRNFAQINKITELGHATTEDPAYLMTRDGFTLLAMGFTGKKALEWKLRYIEAFNAMYAGMEEMRRRIQRYEEQLQILEKRIMTLAATPLDVMNMTTYG